MRKRVIGLMNTWSRVGQHSLVCVWERNSGKRMRSEGGDKLHCLDWGVLNKMRLGRKSHIHRQSHLRCYVLCLKAFFHTGHWCAVFAWINSQKRIHPWDWICRIGVGVAWLLHLILPKQKTLEVSQQCEIMKNRKKDRAQGMWNIHRERASWVKSDSL